jgi:lysophospholipase L1-like esterase
MTSSRAHRRLWIVVGGSAVLLAVAALIVAFPRTTPDPSPTSPLPLPGSIAALGDSITRAANASGTYGDAPELSWSTGSDTDGGLQSHAERIAGAEGVIRRHNLAESGARVADLPRQAERAVVTEAEYVTILVGANDACTSSRRTMTGVRAFRTEFRSAMDILTTGLPDARILVVSIPSTYRLWEIYGDDPMARSVWDVGQICPSMLSPANTEEDRQAVLTRIRRFNDVLDRVCGHHPRCRFDDHAAFGFRFGREHVSTLDYFHPTPDGQAALADLSWERGWWPDHPMND